VLPASIFFSTSAAARAFTKGIWHEFVCCKSQVVYKSFCCCGVRLDPRGAFPKALLELLQPETDSEAPTVSPDEESQDGLELFENGVAMLRAASAAACCQSLAAAGLLE
jgi:hypothetical protein